MNEPHEQPAVAAVLEQMRSTSGQPRLNLDAATPLETLPPELVALIVGRVQAGASPFGSDHPRRFIVKRVVIPSAALAVLDLVGLVSAVSSGRTVLWVVAAVLLVVLAYFAFAGVRFVRQDPLRVTPDQRAYVEQVKRWRSKRSWTGTDRTGPWARLVGTAVDATDRISASDAWTWASIAPHRASIELGETIDTIDHAAHERIGEPVPGQDDVLVRRVAALVSLADGLDELVGRSAEEGVRDVLPDTDDRRFSALTATASQPR